MKCGNCGGEIKENDPKCPFCGAMYYPGAEKKYMENLKHIKENMSGLIENPDKEMKKSVPLFLLIALLVVVASLAVIWTGYFVKDMQQSARQRLYEEEEYQQIEWEDINFPLLDQWYGEKNYNAVIDFMQMKGNKGFVLDNWEHIIFMNFYQAYLNCIENIEQLKAGEFGEYLHSLILYDGLTLLFESTTDKIKLQYNHNVMLKDQKEIQLYAEKLRPVFLEALHISYTEAEELYNNCLENDRLSLDKLDPYANEFYEKSIK